MSSFLCPDEAYVTLQLRKMFQAELRAINKLWKVHYVENICTVQHFILLVDFVTIYNQVRSISGRTKIKFEKIRLFSCTIWVIFHQDLPFWHKYVE